MTFYIYIYMSSMNDDLHRDLENLKSRLITISLFFYEKKNIIPLIQNVCEKQYKERKLNESVMYGNA